MAQDFTAAFNNLISVRGLRDYRDLVDLVEIYDPQESDFVASNALYRWSTERITWGGYNYERVLLDRGDISRFYGGEFNEVMYTLSNVKQTIGGLFFTTNLEGYILVHRVVSRSLDDGASYAVPFVGRCQKAVGAAKTRATLRARQFLGEVNTMIPPKVAMPRCPLPFKGEGCLGGEALGSKSVAYQLASVCNKSWDQCKEYSNEEKFQGIRILSAQGTFKFKTNRGGAGGALLSLLGLGRKKITKQWTTQDDGFLGQAIPEVLGRAQMKGIPLAHADTGTFIAWVVAWCRGKVNGILNARATTPGFDYSQDIYHYLGDYGGIGTQTPGTPGPYFSGTPIDYNSRLAFSTGVSHSDSPDTGDPAPEISAVILGAEMATPTIDGSYTDSGYSDNPADVSRYVITETDLLNHPPALWNDWAAYKVWQECNEPLLDESKSEQVLIESGATGMAGVDWKIYRSSSVFDVHWLRFLLGLTADHSSMQEIAYAYFTPASPPTSVAAIPILRKRYTCNVGIVAQDKAVDFLFKTIFPTARLYMVTGADGKVNLRREKPSTSTLLRDAVIAGASALPIEDVFQWMDYFEPLVLIGVGLSTSEVRRIAAIRHSTAGNSISLATSGTGITCTASGATFSGATDETPAIATVVISGTPNAGDIVSATIDGVACSYTLTADDTNATAAGMLAATINANTTLNRYVKAVWTGYPDVHQVKWENASYFQIAGATATAIIDVDDTVSGNPNGVLCARVQTKEVINEDGQSFAFQVQNQGQADAASLDALIIAGLTDIDNPTPTPVVNGSQTYSEFDEPEYQFYFALGTGNVPVVYARTNIGGSPALLTSELEYTTNSTFRITRVNSTTIKWYVDGVEVASQSGAVPANLRLAAVSGSRVAPAYLQGRILNARFIDSLSASDTTIKLVAKIGWLDLETPVANAHSLAEECIWIAMLFSDRAQDVNSRANIVKDSCEFPVSGRQSSVNQVQIKYTDPLLDFAQVETHANDYEHQTQVRSVNSIEVNAQGIDSYHQAHRIGNNLLAKLRACDFFVEWSSGPMALGVEEGDVVAISCDVAGAGKERLWNFPVRIEDVRISKAPYKTSFAGRKYLTSAYSDNVEVRTVPLVTGTVIA